MLGVQQWIYRVLYLIIFMNLFVQLVHKESYGRYLRVAAGWLLALYILNPIAQWLSGSGSLDGLPEIPQATEELTGEELSGMDGRMLAYYEQGMEEQILQFIRDEGYEPLGVRVSLAYQGDTMGITGIWISLAPGQEVAPLKESLSSYYHISQDLLYVTIPDGASGQ
ncbi:MAG: stage III sporulation protein AF [Lachnospiraceae bacterium]|nr:stage III sporulation protein AF [Lachnospiraceae bacterium]